MSDLCSKNISSLQKICISYRYDNMSITEWDKWVQIIHSFVYDKFIYILQVLAIYKEIFFKLSYMHVLSE